MEGNSLSEQLTEVYRDHWTGLYWLFLAPLSALYFSLPLAVIAFMGVLDVIMKRKSLEYGFNLFGIQLEALIAIIAGIVYGPLNGALIAGTVYFIASIVSQNVGPFLLWKTPGFALLAGMTAFVYPAGNFFMAFQLPAVFRIVFVIVGLKLTPAQAAQGVLYEGTAPIFTLFMFQAFGERILEFLLV